MQYELTKKEVWELIESAANDIKKKYCQGSSCEALYAYQTIDELVNVIRNRFKEKEIS